MKCRVHVYLLNEHFSQEYADMHHAGKDSELNLRYEWEDELAITTPVSSIKECEQAVYSIKGTRADDSEFCYDVPAMRLFELHSEDGVTLIGCSESILDSCSKEEEEGGYVLRIYLKDFEPMSNPIHGIYIAAQEFPKELIQ